MKRRDQRRRRASAVDSSGSGGMTRREFLAAGAGAGLIAARLRLPIIRPRSDRPRNILVLMTDQERYPTHWPAGWAEQNLPAMARIKRNGLTFNRAYTAAAECSPSRAVMLSGQHANVNQVAITLKPPGLPTKNQLVNVASLLQQHTDYIVSWKGKWHLSFSLQGNESWTEADIAGMADRFGPLFWNPPDAGTSAGGERIETLGGGIP